MEPRAAPRGHGPAAHRRAGALGAARDVLLLGRRQGQPGLRADAERERGRDRREASEALRGDGHGAAASARAGHRGAAPRARAAGPLRRRDRHVPGRARLRRPGALRVLRGVRGPRRRRVRASGGAADRAGPDEEVLFPADRRQPAGDGLAISTLVFGGVLERLPRLRICFAHGGGAFPFTLAWLNHGWAVRPEGPSAIPREPREYARRIWVDSLTLGASNLRFIVDELGMDRVVIGSDYPFDMGADDPVRAVAPARLVPAALTAIVGGAHAARVLGLGPRAG